MKIIGRTPVPDESEAFDAEGQLEIHDEEAEAKRWTSALTLTGLLLTLFFIACWVVVKAASPEVDHACSERQSGDEHALMEAFFRDPPESNAVVQATHPCSR
jgi:hypothetical protein